MSYDFFLEYYHMDEFEIEEIYVQNGILSITLSMPIYLELIANGYRPEMDMKQTKTFQFHVEGVDKKYPKDIPLHFSQNIISIGEDNLRVTLSMVDIR